MEFVKVHFELDIEEDGFPPIGVETLNASLIDSHTFRLENTPFFVDSVALGDTLNCSKIKNGSGYKFNKVIKESGNKAISIIFVENNCSEEILQHLKKLGCYCEYGKFKGYNMLAVSIDMDLDYSMFATYLNEKEKEGKISYSELCI